MSKIKSFKGAPRIARTLRRNTISESWQLRWKPVCASTEHDLSKWLNEKPLLGNLPRAIIANRQTHGRGQRGKKWHSPMGGVWMSAAIPISHQKTSSSLFGLAVAVALSERLEKGGVLLKIKWPNDLIIGKRKLAGLLPRLVYRGGELKLARVGIGLNVLNHVPHEGIALREVLNFKNHRTEFWASEILLALESAIELTKSSQVLRKKAEERLWSQEYKDPKTYEIWQVIGIALNGALCVKKGSKYKELIHWE